MWNKIGVFPFRFTLLPISISLSKWEKVKLINYKKIKIFCNLLHKFMYAINIH
jgi:hypothetical protein